MIHTLPSPLLVSPSVGESANMRGGCCSVCWWTLYLHGVVLSDKRQSGLGSSGRKTLKQKYHAKYYKINKQNR